MKQNHVRTVLRAMLLTGAVVLALAACGSSPASPAASGPAGGADELNPALRETSDYLNGRLTQGVKVVFLNFKSDYPDLSEYVINRLIENTVNDGLFIAVDRQNLALIQQEMDFQLSGEVSDDTAQSIGEKLGAQVIVSGSIAPLGDLYMLIVRAIGVEGAEIQGQFSRDIPPSGRIIALTRNRGAAVASTGSVAPSGGTASSGSAQAASGEKAAPTASVAQAAPATPAYKIGDTGPAGGLIFYDKGNNSGGWRYLEAAPASTETKAIWAIEGEMWSQTAYSNLQNEMGTGKTNTQDFMEQAEKHGGGFGWAPQVCDELSVNGFDDWFLPSGVELNYLYGNLHRKGLGEFRNDRYWSSSQSNGYPCPLTINFSDGSQGNGFMSYEFRVRAIRRF